MGEPVLSSRSSPPTPIIRKINHGLQLLEEGTGSVESTGSVQCCSPSVGVSLVQSQLGFVTRPDHQTGDESRPTPSDLHCRDGMLLACRHITGPAPLSPPIGPRSGHWRQVVSPGRLIQWLWPGYQSPANQNIKTWVVWLQSDDTI